MSSKIVFVDLDGVVADSTTRFEFATVDGKLKWDLALNGAYVHFDTLIDQVAEHLDTLESHGYRVVFLTSRPEHMRSATEHWLSQHGVMTDQRLLEMKPANAQYVKTPVWKAEKLFELASDLGATSVLFIDDEQKTIDEVLSRDTQQVTPRTYTSLAEAVRHV